MGNKVPAQGGYTLREYSPVLVLTLPSKKKRINQGFGLGGVRKKEKREGPSSIVWWVIETARVRGSSGFDGDGPETKEHFRPKWTTQRN